MPKSTRRSEKGLFLSCQPLSYGPPERLAELEYRRLARDRAIPNPRQINLFNARVIYVKGVNLVLADLGRCRAVRRGIFTGVGVFMGPLANLPSFMRLVK